MDNESIGNASKKPLFIGLVLAVVVLIVAVALISGKADDDSALEETDNGMETEEQVFSAGEVEAIRGVVVRNDVSQVPADGPGFLVVDSDDGRTVEVVYSCGMLPVVNTEAYDAGAAAKAGDTVEASGVATDEDTISVCESQEYYLRTEAEETTTEFEIQAS